MSRLPQWDAGENTSHHFADGMYCRVLFQPAGILVVGKMHKKTHFYVVCSGTIAVANGDDPAKEITGPAVIISEPGTKRAIFAVTDTTYLTVHRTDKTDLDEIEEEVIIPDETALFDARNKLKVIS
jgi:hypothetical protein